jgi:hypothetical protein
MASSVQAYSITITNGNDNSAPNDGFIDNLTIPQYYTSLETTPSSLTFALTCAKRRGNFRWVEINNQLSMVANCYVDWHSFTSDATGKTEASAFAYQIYAEHGDASLITADELNPGQFLTSTACIRRCIARALAAVLVQEADIFDPTSSTSVPVGTTSVIRFGDRILPGGTTSTTTQFEVGAYETDLLTGATMIAVSLL